MAHKTLIGGTAYDVKGGRTLIGGTGYNIKGGRTLLGGTGYNISFGTPIGTLAVGTSVYLHEAGSPVEYIIVHQGLPSEMYDASCNGAWLLRKEIFEKRPWYGQNVNDWANSTLKAYLDSTFFARYSANIQNTIKQVKIPYRPGSGWSKMVNSGANGLSCKVFALSGYEMGWTNSDNQYFPPDGAKLSYFDSGTGTTANNKRIGYLSGSVTGWWLRSPYTNSSENAWRVYVHGDYSNNYCSNSYGVRPALVLPPSVSVGDDNLVI